MKKFKKQFLTELEIKDRKAALKDVLNIQDDTQRSSMGRLKKRNKLVLQLTSLILILGVVVFGSVTYVRFINMPTYQNMQVLESLLDQETQLGFQSSIVPRYVNPVLNQVSDPFTETIDEDFGIILSDDIEYYTQASETITIIINLDNPQSFEILSFTLNNRLYQSFEFLPGSNSEQLLISFTVQDFSGPQDITIDAIKYVEGTSINDARFEGDVTIKIGVEYETLPNVSNVAELTESTSFGVSFTLNNHYDLINDASPAYLYVFDGESIINQFTLQVGNNVVPFTSLKMGTTYEYAIVAAYDPLDGDGRRAFILGGNTFTTNQGIEETNVEAFYDSISFDITTIDDKVLDVLSVKIYQGDALVQEISESLSSYLINDLLSNSNYSLEIEYTYLKSLDTPDESFIDIYRFQVSTLEKEIPTVTIDSLPTSDSLLLTIEFSDTDIVTFEKVEILLNETLLETRNTLDDLNFAELLSDTTYTFKTYYSYDLNDGNGTTPIVNETNYNTIAKIEPILTITSMITFVNTLFASFTVEDPDDLLNIIRFDLYKDDILVDTILSDNIELLETNQDNVFKGDLTFSFSGPGDYLLVAVYSFDLNDGNGEILIDSTDINDDNTLRYIAS